jgi:hypothetical protein
MEISAANGVCSQPSQPGSHNWSSHTRACGLMPFTTWSAPTMITPGGAAGAAGESPTIRTNDRIAATSEKSPHPTVIANNQAQLTARAVRGKQLADLPVPPIPFYANDSHRHSAMRQLLRQARIVPIQHKRAEQRRLIPVPATERPAPQCRRRICAHKPHRGERHPRTDGPRDRVAKFISTDAVINHRAQVLVQLVHCGMVGPVLSRCTEAIFPVFREPRVFGYL